MKRNKKYIALLLAAFQVLLAGCSRETVAQVSFDPAPAVYLAEAEEPVCDMETAEQIPETEEPQTEPQEEITEETQVVVSQLDHEAVQEMIDSLSQAYGAVGVQVAVVEQGTVTGTFAYGWATKDTDPMTADHKIRVASITKVVVGMAAMLLQEDGVIDLDADIGSYWGAAVSNPSYPGVPITIRSMLTHTSSIMCYGDAWGADHSGVLYRLKNGGFSDLLPGDISSWYYNNYAFRVLGMTLELAAQERLDDYLQERLFAALDIDAAFASGDIQNTQLLATLYRASGEVARSVQTQQNLHLTSEPGGDGIYYAGGLTVSAADLAKLVALLASDGVYEGQQLLAAESVALMEQYMAEAVPDGSYQAMPLFYAPGLYGREGIYFHPGIAYGVYGCISYDPVTGDGVVVLTVGADGDTDQYDISLLCAAINSYLYGVMES